jgi:hypothetical protein
VLKQATTASTNFLPYSSSTLDVSHCIMSGLGESCMYPITSIPNLTEPSQMLVTDLRRTVGVPNTKCEQISPSD